MHIVVLGEGTCGIYKSSNSMPNIFQTERILVYLSMSPGIVMFALNVVPFPPVTHTHTKFIKNFFKSLIMRCMHINMHLLFSIAAETKCHKFSGICILFWDDHCSHKKSHPPLWRMNGTLIKQRRILFDYSLRCSWKIVVSMQRSLCTDQKDIQICNSQ
jgi:hypothetical protein